MEDKLYIKSTGPFLNTQNMSYVHLYFYVKHARNIKNLNYKNRKVLTRSIFFVGELFPAVHGFCFVYTWVNFEALI
jgi:hypothetical protein